MSADKNPEIVGCDASIMKNVWEMKMREIGQKKKAEQERIEKSALQSINKEWSDRLAAKMGKVKGVERKIKPPAPKLDNSNIWKDKQPMATPNLPHGAGSYPLAKQEGQSKGFSTSVPHAKDKKGQFKVCNRLGLLMFITQHQPSPLVWGKSWKNAKPLPSQAECDRIISDWGQCWMLVTQQPDSEEGKPWKNGPNIIDPHSLHLWKKPEYKMVESQDFGSCHLTDDWLLSWKRSDKNNKGKTSVNGENFPENEVFTVLAETQRCNEDLCSSEWMESWRCTKPGCQQNSFTSADYDLMNKSFASKQGKDKDMSSLWEDCWRFGNHQGCKSDFPQVKSVSPDWANSWRAGVVILGNHKNSDPSLNQDHTNTYDFVLFSPKKMYQDLPLQLCKESKALSEWNKSWQVAKNNSKPCAEIEKVLKISPQQMETQKKEHNQKGQYLTSDIANQSYEQPQHNVIYHPKKEFTHSRMITLKKMEGVISASEWRESWKAVKHQMKMERRGRRADRLRLLRESKSGGDMRPCASEWKDSWKVPRQNQEFGLWEQRWLTTHQIRVDRWRDENHFAPVELPKNGPTEERGWRESWRFPRLQQRPEPRQSRQQTTHPAASFARQGHAKSVSDWQEAWMVSESQFHHDKPSLTQWTEAWRSVYHTDHCTEQPPHKNCMDEFMEIQASKENASLQKVKVKMNLSFDSRVFRERYPEKEWGDSWKAGSHLNYQIGPCGLSGKPVNSGTSHAPVNDKWGRSFRLANPMPHLGQPWVESSPNSGYYAVMWSRKKKIQTNINTIFSNNPSTLKLWGNSHQFLQGVKGGIVQSKEPVDHRLIVKKKPLTRRNLHSEIKVENQPDKKWVGCHLLSKTQPRPKRNSPVSLMNNIEDETNKKFNDEWAESWKFLLQLNGMKKQMVLKSFSGWDDSWKFLLPLYQTLTSKVK